MAGGPQHHPAHPSLGQVGTLLMARSSRADFVFDRSRNIYIFPNGKLLHTTGTVIDLQYASLSCLKSSIAISVHSKCTVLPPLRLRGRFLAIFSRDARDVQPAHWPKPRLSSNHAGERKKVEMRFAHMKRILKLDRLRLRGLNGAKDEVLLTATTQNLRRLVKFLCRPPPSAAVTLSRPSPAASSGYRDHHNKLTNTQISSAAKSSRVLQHNHPQSDRLLRCREMSQWADFVAEVC